MTQNTLDSEIERVVKELQEQFPIQAIIYTEKQNYGHMADLISFVQKSLKSIAEKSIEAVRVEMRNNVDEVVINNKSYHVKEDMQLVLKIIYNAAVTEQTNLANRWLGKE